MSITCYKFIKIESTTQLSIVGSVVECSPATRAARVRFPDDAKSFCHIYINDFYGHPVMFLEVLVRFHRSKKNLYVLYSKW